MMDGNVGLRRMSWGTGMFSAMAVRRPQSFAGTSVERLEVRRALTGFVVDNAADESDGDYSAGDLSLREALELSNANSDLNTITFDASLNGQTISLTITGDTTFGPTALIVTNPVEIIGGSIALAGLGASASQRAFYVSASGSLTLENLTVQDFEFEGGRGGVGGGGGAAGLGGAIFNQGTLVIKSSTF